MDNLATANARRARLAGQRRAADIDRLLVVEAVIPRTAVDQEILELRRGHPNATLAQLAAMCHPPVTKDAYASRLRRILREFGAWPTLIIDERP